MKRKDAASRRRAGKCLPIDTGSRMSDPYGLKKKDTAPNGRARKCLPLDSGSRMSDPYGPNCDPYARPLWPWNEAHSEQHVVPELRLKLGQPCLAGVLLGFKKDTQIAVFREPAVNPTACKKLKGNTTACG